MADSLILQGWNTEDSVLNILGQYTQYARGKVEPGTSRYVYLPFIHDPVNPVNENVYLSFDQICKVDILDIASPQYSFDGVTWVTMLSSRYLGTGMYGTLGNRFASNSYASLWQPAIPAAQPESDWWKHEIFDITNLMPGLSGEDSVQIRFYMGDGGPTGGNSHYGWLLDNIMISRYSGVGLQELVRSDIHVYPNPVISFITFSKTIYQVQLCDITGKVVYTADCADGIDMSGLGKGIYYLRDASSFITRIIKM